MTTNTLAGPKTDSPVRARNTQNSHTSWTKRGGPDKYDKANSVISVTDAAGTIDITPDDDGHSEKIKFPGSDRILIDYDYKDSGKAEEARVTNQAGTELREYKYDYTDGTDAEDQLQSRDASGTLIPDGAIDYEYENGTLDKATDSASGGVDYDYSHDNINNVTSETVGSTTTYFGYDRAGQLCWRGTTDGTKLGTTCPTTPSGDTTLSHDAAGNNTNTDTTPTTYNNHNQVTELGTLDMGYLDLGNDLRTDAGTAQFVEGPLGITARKDGTAITFYTRAPDGTILDARVAGATASKYNYFTEPHSQSVAAIYAPDGSEVGSYEYSPYGETTASGSDAADNPFRYISGYQDTAGSEDYYKLGARYYDTHGHFTQPDPLAGNATDPKTMTAYNYAAGDPINSSDPSGLRFRDPDPTWFGRKPKPIRSSRGCTAQDATNGLVAAALAAGGAEAIVAGAGASAAALPVVVVLGGTLAVIAGGGYLYCELD